MKRKNTLSALLLFTLLAFAQPPHSQEGGKDKGRRFEEFKAQKTAFLVREVGITPEEAAQFFPLYDEMSKKRITLFHRIRKQQHQLMRQGEGQRAEAYQTLLNQMLDAPIEEANIEKEYYDKMKAILSTEKLIRVKMAEDRFAKTMFKPGQGK